MEVFMFGFIVGAVVLFLVMVAVGDWQSNRVPKSTWHWECPLCPMLLDAPQRNDIDKAIGVHLMVAHGVGQPTRSAP